MKKAILFGASGFVGSYLLDQLLNSDNYEQVTIVVRKDLGIHNPKLITLIGDYHSLPSLKEQIEADEIFITLGTTKKKTPDPVEYYQVDHDYPVLAAQIAREKGATSVFIVTAIGANPNSKIAYVRTKGDAERDIIALDYHHTNIFRPSMIMGERQENRPLEKLMLKLWKVINPLFGGKISNYRGITGQDIARSMVNAAKVQTQKVRIYHWKHMQELL